MVIIKIRKYHHAISGQKLQKKIPKISNTFLFFFFLYRIMHRRRKRYMPSCAELNSTQHCLYMFTLNIIVFT